MSDHHASHHAQAVLEAAFLLDRAGREKKAIAHYRKALSLGLPPELRCDAMVCLASSLETAGYPQAALRCLRRAKAEFDTCVAIDLFIASALQSCGRERQAVAVLAARLLRDAPKGDRVGRYARVLRRKLGVRTQ
jgi:tetratricopeptide (TPR) repeat protein